MPRPATMIPRSIVIDIVNHVFLHPNCTSRNIINSIEGEESQIKKAIKQLRDINIIVMSGSKKSATYSCDSQEIDWSKLQHISNDDVQKINKTTNIQTEEVLKSDKPKKFSIYSRKNVPSKKVSSTPTNKPVGVAKQHPPRIAAKSPTRTRTSVNVPESAFKDVLKYIYNNPGCKMSAIINHLNNYDDKIIKKAVKSLRETDQVQKSGNKRFATYSCETDVVDLSKMNLSGGRRTRGEQSRKEFDSVEDLVDYALNEGLIGKFLINELVGAIRKIGGEEKYSYRSVADLVIARARAKQNISHEMTYGQYGYCAVYTVGI